MQLGRWNANAGVMDRELNLLPPIIAGDRRQTQHDFPRVREFDRIPDQIVQHLRQPARVAQNGLGHVGVELTHQRQSLGTSRRGQPFDRIANDHAQIERNFFRLDMARLDPGKLQDIVDDLEQGLGRGLDHRQVFALLLVQRGRQRQLGHADDAIHRGPNFMAHVGQKIRLCPLGPFSKLVGLAQFLPQSRLSVMGQHPMLLRCLLTGGVSRVHFRQETGQASQHPPRSRPQRTGQRLGLQGLEHSRQFRRGRTKRGLQLIGKQWVHWQQFSWGCRSVDATGSFAPYPWRCAAAPPPASTVWAL